MEKKFLTIHEAAEVLGIHPSTILTMCRTGQLRAIQWKARARWRIPVEAIQEWADKNTYTP